MIEQPAASKVTKAAKAIHTTQDIMVTSGYAYPPEVEHARRSILVFDLKASEEELNDAQGGIKVTVRNFLFLCYMKMSESFVRSLGPWTATRQPPTRTSRDRNPIWPIKIVFDDITSRDSVMKAQAPLNTERRNNSNKKDAEGKKVPFPWIVTFWPDSLVELRKYKQKMASAYMNHQYSDGKLANGQEDLREVWHSQCRYAPPGDPRKIQIYVRNVQHERPWMSLPEAIDRAGQANFQWPGDQVEALRFLQRETTMKAFYAYLDGETNK